MNCSLPIWVQVASALSTPAVALIVAWIAWRQWRTAREKLVLDLFEKRWEIFHVAEAAVGLVIRDGDARENDAIRDVAVLRSKASFLFGDEVEKYLGDLQKRMAQIGLANDMMASHNHEKPWPKIKNDNFIAILKFNEEFSKLCAPYMHIKSKL